jgi:hypothetical protein
VQGAVPLDVVGGGPQDRRVVLELAEAAVALEAQQLPDDAGRVVVVDVRGWCGTADGAETALCCEHGGRVCRRDPVPPLEVAGTGPADLLLDALPRALWHGVQQGARPDGWLALRTNWSNGFTVEQSGHHLCPSGTCAPLGCLLFGGPRRASLALRRRRRACVLQE